MRVVFNGAEFVNDHGSRFPDTPGVVAAEVHEHHVLRSLLRIVAEFLFHHAVMLYALSPATRPCNRTNIDPFALQANQDLGRRSDQDSATGADEDQVGARIHPAKLTIDFEGLDLQRQRE